MKVNYMALIMSGLFSSGLWAATNNHPTDIEKRLAQLEQRVINAEQRAADAEAKIQTLTRQQSVVAKSTPTVKVESAEPVAPGAEPTTLTLSGYGDIKFYGDVEFNMDGASSSGSLTSVKTTANKDWAPGNNERWDINGRLLLGFDGMRGFVE